MTARHPLRAALEQRDASATAALLAPGAVLRGPVTAAPFRGRARVAHVLALVADVLEELEYTADAPLDAERHVLAFRGRIGRRPVEGVDVLRTDAAGLIGEVTVTARPLSGVMAFAATLGPALLAGTSRPLGAAAAVALRPLPGAAAAVLDRAGPAVLARGPRAGQPAGARRRDATT